MPSSGITSATSPPSIDRRLLLSTVELRNPHAGREYIKWFGSLDIKRLRTNQIVNIQPTRIYNVPPELVGLLKEHDRRLTSLFFVGYAVGCRVLKRPTSGNILDYCSNRLRAIHRAFQNRQYRLRKARGVCSFCFLEILWTIMSKSGIHKAVQSQPGTAESRSAEERGEIFRQNTTVLLMQRFSVPFAIFDLKM